MPETETKCSEWRMLKLPADWEAPAGTERSLNKLHWLCKNDGSRFNCQGPNQDEPLYERSDYWSLWSHFCPTLQMIPQAFFSPPLHLGYTFTWRRILMYWWWHVDKWVTVKKRRQDSRLFGLEQERKSCSLHWFLSNLCTKLTADVR